MYVLIFIFHTLDQDWSFSDFSSRSSNIQVDSLDSNNKKLILEPTSAVSKEKELKETPIGSPDRIMLHRGVPLTPKSEIYMSFVPKSDNHLKLSEKNILTAISRCPSIVSLSSHTNLSKSDSSSSLKSCFSPKLTIGTSSNSVKNVRNTEIVDSGDQAHHHAAHRSCSQSPSPHCCLSPPRPTLSSSFIATPSIASSPSLYKSMSSSHLDDGKYNSVACSPFTCVGPVNHLNSSFSSSADDFITALSEAHKRFALYQSYQQQFNVNQNIEFIDSPHTKTTSKLPSISAKGLHVLNNSKAERATSPYINSAFEKSLSTSQNPISIRESPSLSTCSLSSSSHFDDCQSFVTVASRPNTPLTPILNSRTNSHQRTRLSHSAASSFTSFYSCVTTPKERYHKRLVTSQIDSKGTKTDFRTKSLIKENNSMTTNEMRTPTVFEPSLKLSINKISASSNRNSSTWKAETNILSNLSASSRVSSVIGYRSLAHPGHRQTPAASTLDNNNNSHTQKNITDKSSSVKCSNSNSRDNLFTEIKQNKNGKNSPELNKNSFQDVTQHVGHKNASEVGLPSILRSNNVNLESASTSTSSRYIPTSSVTSENSPASKLQLKQGSEAAFTTLSATASKRTNASGGTKVKSALSTAIGDDSAEEEIVNETSAFSRTSTILNLTTNLHSEKNHPDLESKQQQQHVEHSINEKFDNKTLFTSSKQSKTNLQQQQHSTRTTTFSFNSESETEDSTQSIIPMQFEQPSELQTPLTKGSPPVTSASSSSIADSATGYAESVVSSDPLTILSIYGLPVLVPVQMRPSSRSRGTLTAKTNCDYRQDTLLLVKDPFSRIENDSNGFKASRGDFLRLCFASELPSKAVNRARNKKIAVQPPVHMAGGLLPLGALRSVFTLDLPDSDMPNEAQWVRVRLQLTEVIADAVEETKMTFLNSSQHTELLKEVLIGDKGHVTNINPQKFISEFVFANNAHANILIDALRTLRSNHIRKNKH